MAASSISSRGRCGLIAVVLFIVFSGFWTAATLHTGSGWIKTGAAHGVNSILGYSESEQANIVHKENRSFLQQIAMFSGATTDVIDHFYIIRPTYAYLAAFMAPVFGIVGAALAMNWIGWALAALCAWHLANLLFRDPRAGLVAVAFVSMGLGFIVHIADYSAHLLAFTTYYLGSVVLIQSEIWKAPAKNRTTHITIGAFLAICCLTYNMGLALVIAYIVTALRHNRIVDIALATALALSAQYLWPLLLNIGLALKTGQWTWYNLYDNDGDYFSGSMRQWLHVWSTPIEGLGNSIFIFVQFLSFEFPLTVIGALFAIPLLAWRQRQAGIVIIVLFLAPIGGAMAYAQQAAARGYLIYGISLVAFVALAGLLVSFMHIGARWRRPAAIAACVFLLAGQAAWSGAHLVGQLGPLRAYYLGGSTAVDELTEPPMTVISLTGEEPRPAWFRGNASMSELGLYQSAGPYEPGAGYMKRLAVSLGSRALLSLYIVAVIVLLLWGRGRKFWRTLIATTAFVYVLPSAIMAATVKDSYRFVSVDTAGPGIACRSLEYSVRISDNFRQEWKSLDPDKLHLELYFRLPPDTGPAPEVFFDGHAVSVAHGPDDGRWVVKDPAWKGGVLDVHIVTLRQRFAGKTQYFGWQRAGLPGRKLALEGCGTPVSAPVAPGLELRAVTGSGAPVLVGF